MRKKARIMILMLIGLSLGSQTLAQRPVSDSLPEKSYGQEEFHSPFRYVVVDRVTKLQKYVNRMPDNQILEVLIEEKAFNEKDLKTLGILLSDRFKPVDSLSVYIYTSLEAIKTPEEQDHSSLLGPIANVQRFNYAVFERNTFGNEWVRYWESNVKNEKIIVIKGCYIECK